MFSTQGISRIAEDLLREISKLSEESKREEDRKECARLEREIRMLSSFQQQCLKVTNYYKK